MFSRNRTGLVSCRWLALLLMLIYAPAGLTVDDDIKTDIQIQANYMRFDLETGSSVYNGNVKIKQGSIEIYGDKVTVWRQQDEIQQINIEGQPVRYTQDEDTEKKIHATSQHMQYLANEHRLVMTVNARLEQPDHTIESQRIVYDTENKIVIAGEDKPTQEGGRVSITLTPKKENGTVPPDTTTDTAPTHTEKP